VKFSEAINWGNSKVILSVSNNINMKRMSGSERWDRLMLLMSITIALSTPQKLGVNS
jgi:hypothetical protein